MGRLSAHREEELLVAERAADWLRRLETAGSTERAEFMAWLKESPRHVREILLATTWDKVLDKIDPQRRIDLDTLFASGAREMVQLNVAHAIGESGTHSLSLSRRSPALQRRWRIAGLATVAAVLAFAMIWIPMTLLEPTYATAIGEQRTVELPDGSTIYLNARSRMKMDFSDKLRDVHLLEGQAIFKVKHETTRPFRVHVDGMFVQAVGTQFDVHRLTAQTNVAVIEGKVKISTDESPHSDAVTTIAQEETTLAAGETASIVADGKITRAATLDVADATAWRQRRLVFRKQSLTDIALEFNRYNRAMQIRIEDEGLRSRQFNGVFDADDPESLIRFLERSDGVAVERKRREVVIRKR